MEKNPIIIGLGILLIIVLGSNTWMYIYFKKNLTQTEQQLQTANSKILTLEKDLISSSDKQ